MIAAALAAMIAFQPVGGRFDLVCEPLRREGIQSGLHIDQTYSVDLISRRWCERGACFEAAGVEPIAAVDDEAITLLDRNRSTLVFRFGREQMTFTGSGMVLVWRCERRRFSGWWPPIPPREWE